jgi:hypothetical protein
MAKSFRCGSFQSTSQTVVEALAVVARRLVEQV